MNKYQDTLSALTDFNLRFYREIPEVKYEHLLNLLLEYMWTNIKGTLSTLISHCLISICVYLEKYPSEI